MRIVASRVAMLNLEAEGEGTGFWVWYLYIVGVGFFRSGSGLCWWTGLVNGKWVALGIRFGAFTIHIISSSLVWSEHHLQLPLVEHRNAGIAPLADWDLGDNYSITSDREVPCICSVIIWNAFDELCAQQMSKVCASILLDANVEESSRSMEVIESVILCRLIWLS